MVKDHKVYSTADRVEESVLSGLYQKYVFLLRQLHGNEFYISESDFCGLFMIHSERIIFIMKEGQLVASAQATLSMTAPTWHVYVNNVAVEKTLTGQGWEKILETELVRLVEKYWKKDGKMVVMERTIDPEEDDVRLYLSCGWKTRGPSSRDPTVVWVKYI